MAGCHARFAGACVEGAAQHDRGGRCGGLVGAVLVYVADGVVQAKGVGFERADGCVDRKGVTPCFVERA